LSSEAVNRRRPKVPKTPKELIPLVMEGPGFTSRQIEWGGMSVAFEAGTEPMDTTPLFAGLPGGSCQCPHWGYVLTGSITFRYEDRDEVVRAGEVYYAAPGHVPVVTESGSLIEFSPADLYRQTVEGIQAALHEGAST
jgi:hypothetical protein